MGSKPAEFALEPPDEGGRTASDKRRERAKAVRRRESHEENKGVRPSRLKPAPQPTPPFIITSRAPEVKRGGGGESFVENRDDAPAEGWLRYLALTYGAGRYWVSGRNGSVLRIQPTAENVERFERETPRAHHNPPAVAPAAPIAAAAPSDQVVVELRRLNKRVSKLKGKLAELEEVDDGPENEPRQNPVDVDALVELSVKKALGDKPAVDPMKVFELAAKLWAQSRQEAPKPALPNPPDPRVERWAKSIPAMEGAGWTPDLISQFIAEQQAAHAAAATADNAPAPSQT